MSDFAFDAKKTARRQPPPGFRQKPPARPDRSARIARDAARDYWARQLADLPCFELPTDHPRSGGAMSATRVVTRRLTRELTVLLEAAGEARGATLLTTVLATLGIVLHRFSGETDLAIGARIAGPDQAITGDRSAETLVLRLDLAGRPHVPDLLRRIGATLAGALAHRHMPITELAKLLRPAGEDSRHRLVSVSFVYRPLPQRRDAIVARPTDRPDPALHPDLVFHMVEEPDCWRISCEYATSLFEESSAASLLACLDQAFRAIVADPDCAIAALPLLGEAERRALAMHENRTAADFPGALALPDLLAAQAAATPDRVAVAACRHQMSYRELDRSSNRLARYLRSRGIGAGALVGICLDRSLDLVVALLGVMKAGAAYVPLDPSYPARRLGQIVADADLAAILTLADCAAALPAGPVERILLDRQNREIARQSRHPLHLAIPPDDIAYVIFTSGSTGRPKGVRVPHRALVNLLCGMARRPGIDRHDVLVAVTTIAFDIAALEIFLPLSVGAKVVIADRATAADGRALAALLDQCRATVLQATPVTWQILLEAGWRGAPSLKMLCGGEALPRPLAERLLATGGALWNMYGPTETTIWSSAAPVTSGSFPVPIGRPMENTTFHVLDADLQLLPPGAVGELFIGGDGVAAGYLARPDLTAERFLPDPFRPGGRLYRTGDLVRRRAGGGLAFLGRADHQVKLRGFRIELGDIEAALLEQPDVAEAAATVWRDDGRETLVAYVVAHRHGDRTGLAPRLRARLAETLPSYMQPTAITVLDALPRTPNGKLDRAALPTAHQVDLAPAAFADPIEARLAAIWCDTLGVDAVQADDNFFELGGHSLLAARMLATIGATFQRRPALCDLFRAPTLRAFAAALRHDTTPAVDHQLVEVQKSAVGVPVFAINHTWLYHPLARQLGPDRPFYASQVFEPGGIRSIEETAALHVGIIRRTRPHGPYILLGLCSAGNLAYEIAQQLTASGEAVPLTVLIDTWAPDCLANLPWARAKLADWSYRAQMLSYDFRRDGTHSLAEALRFAGRRLGNFLVKHIVGSATPADDPVAALDAAAERYRPKPLRSRLLIFHRDQMPSGPFLDPHFGWDAHGSPDLRVVALPGDHFDMFRRPGVDLMAAEIKEASASFEKEAKLSIH